MFMIAIGVIITSLGCVYLFKPSLFFVAYIHGARLLSGVKRRQYQVGTVTWAYAERGQPRPGEASMLMIHGFSGLADAWNWVIKSIPSSVHVIAVDLPGHGDTEADPNETMEKPVSYYTESLHSFLEEVGMGSQPLHIIGLSMGGAIAGMYSARYPTFVKQVSLVCPAVDTPVPSKMKVAEEESPGSSILLPKTPQDLQTMLNEYVLYKPMNFPLQFLKGMMDARRKYEPFITKLKAQFGRPENKGVMNKVMKDIKVPTHIVWGEHDNIIHVSGAQVLRENMSNVQQYDIIPECGHGVDIEKGKLLAEHLYRFWSQHY